MLISYTWLQSYFDEKLPAPEALAERLAFGFAEVESVEWKNGDAILDVKVLPDRACYALSHRGIAHEVAAILGLEMKKEEIRVPRASRGTCAISVRIADPTLCRRHIARIVGNISVDSSPDWLKNRLESVGQRSINNIVDATNFVTLDMGQPLHAFDADKVKGKVTVRPGRTGEVLVTLDGKNIALDPSLAVIADEEGPLDIAGIKGGKKAELDPNTTAILLSVANFDPVSIRRTSVKIGIKTDASKRFENNLTAERAQEGMDEITALIARLCPAARFGKTIDLYPKKEKKRRLVVPVAGVQNALGITLSEKEMRDALVRLGIPVHQRGKALVVIPPPERLDLARQEDIVEEIGRMVGLERIPEEKLPSLHPPPRRPASPAGRLGTSLKGGIEDSLLEEGAPTMVGAGDVKDIIRDLLASEGFSEVLTSSFASHGEIAIKKPLASDKAFCRKDLWTNFYPALLRNFSNAPLLGTDEVRMFEIGKVFTTKGEHAALIIGVMPTKKSVQDIIQKIEKQLDIRLGGKFCGGNNVYETSLPLAPLGYSPQGESSPLEGGARRAGDVIHFKPFSPYPFIVRDVALFVPNGMTDERVKKVIEGETRGKEVVSIRLFDSFEKALPDGSRKTSYAFRLVFQSMKKTLTDAEANAAMEGVYRVLESRGCEIR